MKKDCKLELTFFHFCQVSLIYANVSPDDILLKRKLDILAESHPNLKVTLVLLHRQVLKILSISLDVLLTYLDGSFYAMEILDFLHGG